jgi:hypothetical protein
MKITHSIALLCASVSFATGQSLVPIDRPEASFPQISDAFDGKTTVRRTVDAGGLAHYMIRFFHEDVVGINRGPYFSDAVLSVTDDQGKILSQSWLDISGVSTESPDKTEFRMIRFTVREALEGGSVLSIGVHKGMRVYFSPYRLAPKTPTAEQAGTGQPATRPESKSKGIHKPQPEAERRSQ